uniref:Keratin-associated protein n=1 Tax=Callorhinus ursinus TaxID=34884 RepID=A0A3Q7RKQ4_CALUR|nr:keratin-associated protein 25-1 [Callorhinus ursinus]
MVNLPATNNPAVGPQPMKLPAIFPLRTVPPGPAEESVFFPIGSYLSSSCQPSMYNRHQNCLSSCFHPQKHFSYGCQPQNFISCGYRPLNFVSSACHPLRYLSYDCQPLGYVFSSFRPLDNVSSRFQPVLYIYKSFQPACSFGTWQTPFVRRSW